MTEQHFGIEWSGHNGRWTATVADYDVVVMSIDEGEWGFDIFYNGRIVASSTSLDEPPVSRKKAMFAAHRALTHLITPD